MIRNWQNKNFKGFAYIDYKDNGSVKKAIGKYNSKPFKGRNLICDAVTTEQKKGFKRHLKPDEEDNEEEEI
jgi:RNA recognition motif-containing protein